MGDDAPLNFQASRSLGSVERGHLSALPGADAVDVQIWADGVASGRVQMWEIHAGAQRVGTIIWDVERQLDGRSAINIQALFSVPVRGVDVFAVVNDKMAKLAALTGVEILRFWTVREGLKRRAERVGFSSRYVMERSIDGEFA